MSGVLWIGPTLSRSYRDYKHVIRHVRNRSVSQFGPTGTPQRTDSSARRSNTYHSRITNSCNALPHPRHTPIGRPNNQALRSIGAENGARGGCRAAEVHLPGRHYLRPVRGNAAELAVSTWQTPAAAALTTSEMAYRW